MDSESKIYLELRFFPRYNYFPSKLGMEAKFIFQRVEKGIEQHNSHDLEAIRKDILQNVKIPKLVTKRFDQLNQISEIELRG